MFHRPQLEYTSPKVHPDSCCEVSPAQSGTRTLPADPGRPARPGQGTAGACGLHTRCLRFAVAGTVPSSLWNHWPPLKIMCHVKLRSLACLCYGMPGFPQPTSGCGWPEDFPNCLLRFGHTWHSSVTLSRAHSHAARRTSSACRVGQKPVFPRLHPLPLGASFRVLLGFSE